MDKKNLSSSKRIQKLKKTIKKQIALNQNVEQQELYNEDVKQINEFIQPKLITIILEEAGLYLRKHKSKIQLLNFEDHGILIEKKFNQDPEHYRPDIVHQSLLTLLDSPLNKAGYLQVLINTYDNQLIKINPETKIPRTYKRFAGMIAQLLEKQKIKTGEDNKILLEIVSGSVQVNIPENNHIISTSHQGKLVDLKQYIKQYLDKNIVIIIGAVSKGQPGLDCKFANDCISISRYQLSTTNCISKFTDTFEELFNIL